MLTSRLFRMLDSTHQALIVQILYHYLILNYANATALLRTVWCVSKLSPHGYSILTAAPSIARTGVSPYVPNCDAVHDSGSTDRIHLITTDGDHCQRACSISPNS